MPDSPVETVFRWPGSRTPAPTEGGGAGGGGEGGTSAGAWKWGGTAELGRGMRRKRWIHEE